MKYGEARYEDQMYGEEGVGKGAGNSKPFEMNRDDMVEPEGLKPGYEGYVVPENKAEQATNNQSESGPTIDPIEQMNELLQKKIDANLSGDTATVEQLEKLIEMHARRNNIPYETL